MNSGAARQWNADSWARRYSIAYDAELNFRYHEKRQHFLSRVHRLTTAVALVSGTAAASALLKDADSKAWAGLAVSVATIFSLVFGLADLARLHTQLRAKYVDLRADLEAAGVLGYDELDKFAARLIRLNADEPPSMTALIIRCQNEMAIAAAQPTEIQPLRWYQNWLAQVFSFSSLDTDAARRLPVPAKPAEGS